MKVQDTIQSLIDLDGDEEIIIAWWNHETMNGDIPKEDWNKFVQDSEPKEDWSAAYESILYSYREWKQAQPKDYTVEPTFCPHCMINLDLTETTYGMVNTDTSIAWREVTCGDCGGVWEEHYNFSHFTIEEQK